MAPVRQVFLVQLLSNPPMYIQSVMETAKFFCFPGLSLPLRPDPTTVTTPMASRLEGWLSPRVSTLQAIGTLPQQTISPKTIFFGPSHQEHGSPSSLSILWGVRAVTALRLFIRWVQTPSQALISYLVGPRRRRAHLNHCLL